MIKNIYIMSFEPQIIDYYSHRSLEKQTKRLMDLNRTNNAEMKRVMHRVFTSWAFNHQVNTWSLCALLNYKNFHNLEDLPEYTVVARSSAGINGWVRAGPHKTTQKTTRKTHK
jgi:hypothetical protein